MIVDLNIMRNTCVLSCLIIARGCLHLHYIPNGVAGLHLRTSKTIAVIYGKDGSSPKAGSIPGATTAAIWVLAFFWISGCNTIARMNVVRLIEDCDNGKIREWWRRELFSNAQFQSRLPSIFESKRSTDGGKRSVSPKYITAAVSLITLSRSAYSFPRGKPSNSGKLSDTNEGNCSPTALQLDAKTNGLEDKIWSQINRHTISFLATSKGWSSIVSTTMDSSFATCLKPVPGNQSGTCLRMGNWFYVQCVSEENLVIIEEMQHIPQGMFQGRSLD
jgi:hypothetical protein